MARRPFWGIGLYLFVAAHAAPQLRGGGNASAKDVYNGPVRLIIDTDAGFDVDDVGAIAVANALQDNGECEIIAVGHTNGYKLGIGAVSTLMHFYGRDNVPLGAYKGEWAANPRAPGAKGTADRYIPDLVDNYPSPIKNYDQVHDAVSVYRKALAESPDGSVHIASIGITTNMRDLVQSKPDQYSELNGHDLIAKKVGLVVWMDGMYNFGCAQHDTDNWLGPDIGCRGSAQAALSGWPNNVNQVFSPVGGDVLHAGWLQNCGNNGNPVRQAFEDWGVAGTGRSSWDPIAVMIAVRGAHGIYCQEAGYGTGHMVVDEAGKERWEGGVGYRHSVVKYSSYDARSKISFELNQLLCKPPGPWGNSRQWVEAKGENCYGPRGASPAHGATDLESPPSASCGAMTLAACQQKCMELPGCTAITMGALDSSGRGPCYRKADVVIKYCDSRTVFSTWVRHDWVAMKGFNCWPGHGADDLDGKAGCGRMSVADCQVKCSQLETCTGIVWKGVDHSGVGDCYRKKNISPADCDHGTSFDTYMTRRYDAASSLVI
eukprot:TRINITY_DN3759_c0_g3_i3.p1 TRINITY_DN3759_c0_g3~~TRINITY_DN3759_c0_g3_i3.p1  ORF type:complete len:560 (-),score=31.26 TRINITY_DN3759_c0_g3_i3:351-1985(-)